MEGFRSRRPGVNPGLVLVLVGLILFLGNLFGHWGAVVLAIVGVVMLATSLQSSHRHFAMPGCLALALAAFAGLLDTGSLRSHVEVWLLLLLSGAFVGIYLLRCRWGNLFPLAIAGILAFAAADGVFGFHTLITGGTVSEVGRWWPMLIIMLGAWMLLSTRLRIPAARIVGPSFLFLFGAFAVLAVDAFWSGPPWTPFSSPDGVHGPFDLPGLPPWAVFARGNATLSEPLDQDIDAAEATTLFVTNDAGSTRIYQTAGSQIRLHATKQVLATDEATARQALDGMTVDMTVSDGRAEVRPRSVDSPRFFSFGPPQWIDMEVGVPAGTTINVESSSGRIRVEGITGDVSIKASSGKAEMENVTGKVDVRLSSGDFRATNVVGEISAYSSSGNLEVVRSTGPRQLGTTSGRIVMDGLLNEAARITTSSGDVRLFASPDSSFKVDFTTSSGSTRYDLPLAVDTHDKHSLIGSYNQGSAPITIRTTSGDLRIMRSGS